MAALRGEVDWLLPLEVEAAYQPVEKGLLVTVGQGVIHAVGLEEQGRPLAALRVLWHDRARQAWLRVPQVAFPQLPYGPTVEQGSLRFELQETIPPLGLCRDYVLAAGAELDQRFSACGGTLGFAQIYRLSAAAEASISVGWTLTEIQQATASLPPAVVPFYTTETVRTVYEGEAMSSSAKLVSCPIRVPGGERISGDVVFRVTEIPEITVDSLPGADLVQRPGQTEGLLTGVIWSVRFRDAHGAALEGPSFWKLSRHPMARAGERSFAFQVPKSAFSMEFVWSLQGRGRVVFDVYDIIVRTGLPQGAAGYSVDVAGKITFPQFEHRLPGASSEFTRRPKVWFSPQLAGAAGQDNSRLLAGLREAGFVPTIEGARTQADVSVALLREDLALPPEISNEPAVLETVKGLPAEGYVLAIRAQGVLARGRDQRGVFYALLELGERLRLGKGRLEPALIIDWPEMPLRMVRHGLQWTRLKDPRAYYERWIPELARLRVNAIAFDARDDWFRLDQAGVREHWLWLAGLCEQWHISLVPMGYNFRNSMPVAATLQWMGAKWVEDEPYTLTDQIPVTLKNKPDGYHLRGKNIAGFEPDEHGNYPIVPLLEASNPVILKSADGQVTYARGRDFIIEGDYEWGRDTGFRVPGYGLKLRVPFSLRRTAESRIPSGATVLLSYNYLYRQRGWQNEHMSTNISEPEARAAVGAALKSTIDLLHPELLHVNQDEVVGIGRDGRDVRRMRAENLTAGQLFADLLNNLKTAARQAGYQGPLIVWNDTLDPIHGGWALSYNGPYYPFTAVDHISPRDFVINIWGYGGGQEIELMSAYYLNRGFGIIGSFTEGLVGIIDWCHYLATLKQERPDQVKGVFMTVWKDPNRTAYMNRRHVARLAWNPAPWVRIGPDGVWIYGLYCRPSGAAVDGQSLLLLPAAATAADWSAWQAGYVRRAALPEQIRPGATLTVNDELGRISQTPILVVGD